MMTNPTTIFKKIKNYCWFVIIIVFFSCTTKSNTETTTDSIIEETKDFKKVPNSATFETNKVTELSMNILSVFQDKNNNYWFGSNADGVYRYDGNNLIQFTEKDGLSNNQVQTIQEDKLGNIWFGTGGFGVSRFDGQIFTNYTNTASLQSNSSVNQDWKIEPDDLWFYAGSGVFRYNGISFTYLPFPKTATDISNRLSPYSVYSILKDKKGNLWFGTQAMGVCRFDGNSFTWFTKKGLAGPAVLYLFEDSKGTIWFGNNGAGVFCYNGKSVINFTDENKLSNTDFWSKSKVSGKPGPGTLARIYSINQDNENNIWIGTVDAGVWRYDGKNLTNFTTKNGLTSNAITTIYKDKKSELWFGTDNGGVCKFDGTSFTKFDFR